MFLKNFEDLQNTGSHRRYSMVLILFAQVMNLRGGSVYGNVCLPCGDSLTIIVLRQELIWPSLLVIFMRFPVS